MAARSSCAVFVSWTNAAANEAELRLDTNASRSPLSLRVPLVYALTAFTVFSSVRD